MTIRKALLLALVLPAFVIHAGTAVLRLGTFLPFPRTLDFAAFYVAAWAVREGQPLYNMNAEWLSALRAATAIPMHPPLIYNPLIWPWMLQPLTLVPYPVASWLWLLFNLIMLAGCVRHLARLAGVRDVRGVGVLAVLTVTFGPVVLDLSLGQTSVLLLATSLTAGSYLSATFETDRLPVTRMLPSILSQGLAGGIKLFPVAWIGAPVLLRRWTPALLGGLAVVAVLLVSFLLSPQESVTYWRDALVGRISTASESVEMDDQSLVAWLQRLALPQSYDVPGLRTDARTVVTWGPPWILRASVVRLLGYSVVGLLGLLVAALLFRFSSVSGSPGWAAEGGFYLWLLFTLLAFPHMARYNHTLLLPALAWLWGRMRVHEASGAARAMQVRKRKSLQRRPEGRGRSAGSDAVAGIRLDDEEGGGHFRRRWCDIHGPGWAVILAYGLTGLSRLNHLWLLVLPGMLAPLASGFGTVGVLILGTAMVAELLSVARLPRLAWRLGHASGAHGTGE